MRLILILLELETLEKDERIWFLRLTLCNLRVFRFTFQIDVLSIILTLIYRPFVIEMLLEFVEEHARADNVCICST